MPNSNQLKVHKCLITHHLILVLLIDQNLLNHHLKIGNRIRFSLTINHQLEISLLQYFLPWNNKNISLFKLRSLLKRQVVNLVLHHHLNPLNLSKDRDKWIKIVVFQATLRHLHLHRDRTKMFLHQWWVNLWRPLQYHNHLPRRTSRLLLHLKFITNPLQLANKSVKSDMKLPKLIFGLGRLDIGRWHSTVV